MFSDIAEKQRYINRLLLVMKSYIMPKSIPNCRPRRCDAFAFILGGSCKYTFSEGYGFEVKGGDILYLAKDSVYSMEVRGKYDFICADFLFDGDTERKSDVFTPGDSQETENLFYKLLRKYSENPSGISQNMTLLYRIYDQAVRSRKIVYLSSDKRSRIEKAHSHIALNFNAYDMSVSSLAAEANMSEVYFRSLFKEIYGVSPSKFITDCRLSQAKELLDLHYSSLDEIAERCGFSSSSYFCRVFKNNLGLTPSEYRDRAFPEEQ